MKCEVMDDAGRDAAEPVQAFTVEAATAVGADGRLAPLRNEDAPAYLAWFMGAMGADYEETPVDA